MRCGPFSRRHRRAWIHRFTSNGQTRGRFEATSGGQLVLPRLLPAGPGEAWTAVRASMNLGTCDVSDPSKVAYLGSGIQRLATVVTNPLKPFQGAVVAGMAAGAAAISSSSSASLSFIRGESGAPCNRAAFQCRLSCSSLRRMKTFGRRSPDERNHRVSQKWFLDRHR